MFSRLVILVLLFICLFNSSNATALINHRSREAAARVIKEPVAAANYFNIQFRSLGEHRWQTGMAMILAGLDLVARYADERAWSAADGDEKNQMLEFGRALDYRVSALRNFPEKVVQYSPADAARSLEEFGAVLFPGLLDRRLPENTELLNVLLKSAHPVWAEMIVREIYGHPKAPANLIADTFPNLPASLESIAVSVIERREDAMEILHGLKAIALKGSSDCDGALQ